MEEAQNDFHASQKINEGCITAKHLRNLHVETLTVVLSRLKSIAKIIFQQDHHVQRTDAGAVLIRLWRESNRNDDCHHALELKDFLGGKLRAVSSFFPN